MNSPAPHLSRGEAKLYRVGSDDQLNGQARRNVTFRYLRRHCCTDMACCPFMALDWPPYEGILSGVVETAPIVMALRIHSEETAAAISLVQQTLKAQKPPAREWSQ